MSIYHSSNSRPRNDDDFSNHDPSVSASTISTLAGRSLPGPLPPPPPAPPPPPIESMRPSNNEDGSFSVNTPEVPAQLFTSTPNVPPTPQQLHEQFGTQFGQLPGSNQLLHASINKPNLQKSQQSSHNHTANFLNVSSNSHVMRQSGLNMDANKIRGSSIHGNKYHIQYPTHHDGPKTFNDSMSAISGDSSHAHSVSHQYSGELSKQGQQHHAPKHDYMQSGQNRLRNEMKNKRNELQNGRERNFEHDLRHSMSHFCTRQMNNGNGNQYTNQYQNHCASMIEGRVPHPSQHSSPQRMRQTRHSSMDHITGYGQSMPQSQSRNLSLHPVRHDSVMLNDQHVRPRRRLSNSMGHFDARRNSNESSGYYSSGTDGEISAGGRNRNGRKKFQRRLSNSTGQMDCHHASFDSGQIQRQKQYRHNSMDHVNHIMETLRNDAGIGPNNQRKSSLSHVPYHNYSADDEEGGNLRDDSRPRRRLSNSLSQLGSRRSSNESGRSRSSSASRSSHGHNLTFSRQSKSSNGNSTLKASANLFSPNCSATTQRTAMTAASTHYSSATGNDNDFNQSSNSLEFESIFDENQPKNHNSSCASSVRWDEGVIGREGTKQLKKMDSLKKMTVEHHKYDFHASASSLEVDSVHSGGVSVKSKRSMTSGVSRHSYRKLTPECAIVRSCEVNPESTPMLQGDPTIEPATPVADNYFNDAPLEGDQIKTSKPKTQCKSFRTCVFITMMLMTLAVVVLIILTLSGAMVMPNKSDESGDESMEQESTESSSPSSQPSVTPPLEYSATILDPPPKDLEGRCSPSNLPGSKTFCLESCRPSACCFRDNDENCFDMSPNTYEGRLNNHRCSLYRPHCGVFFDPWDGAEEGIIRPMPNGLEDVCRNRQRSHVDVARSKSIPVKGDVLSLSDIYVKNSGIDYLQKKGSEVETISNNYQSADGLDPLSDSASDHGNMRGIHSGIGRHNDRSLSDEQQTCLQACLPSKCCQAYSIIGNPADEGFNVFPGPVIVSSLSGDYVMTNCSRKNDQRCKAYAEYCQEAYEEMMGGAIDLEPPQSPSLNATPFDNTTTPTPLSKPSSTPSESSAPSIGHSFDASDNSEKNPSATPSAATSPSQSNTVIGHSESTPPTSSSSLLFVSNPTFSPMTSASSTPSSTPSQSSRPTLPPSIPVAPRSEIDSACTSSESTKLIASENADARLNCLDACHQGMCCFIEIFESAGMSARDNEGNLLAIESCFDGNEDVCAGYSGCLTLTLEPDDISLQQFGRPSTGAIASAIPAPPAPIRDLSILCSEESRASPTGMLQCFKECQKGSCCGAASAELGSCFDAHEEICALYGPCQAMADAYGGDGGPNSPLPPLPPNNLPVICSYDGLLTAKQRREEDSAPSDSECEKICDAASCCFDDTCPEVPNESSMAAEDTREGRCAMYEPCHNLEEIPSPPNSIIELCKIGDSISLNSNECKTVCEAAACCFSSDKSQPNSGATETCFALYEEKCVEYAPHCAGRRDFDGNPTIDQLPVPPANLITLCESSYGSVQDCRKACYQASCCFDSEIENSCFDMNEEVCGQWSLCAEYLQEEDEIFHDQRHLS